AKPQKTAVHAKKAREVGIGGWSRRGPAAFAVERRLCATKARKVHRPSAFALGLNLSNGSA
ncbi:MAG: hypothetical protein JJU00_15450, partial [Opitutales bacterium]|nr:hypothetical protein [Opitutales bacterium]